MADPDHHELTAAVRIGIHIQDADTNEESMFHFYCGARNVDASTEDLLDAGFNLWDNVRDYLSAHTLVRLTHSIWDTTGFTGWHQERARALSEVGGGAGKLPPQLALVVGWRCTFFSGLFPLGRRRNRTYIGPLAPSAINDDGVLDDTARTDITAAWTGLHTELLGIANVTSAAFSGLVVTSPTADEAMSANQLSIGSAIDTMRSRRQRVPEAPVYTGVTPG